VVVVDLGVDVARADRVDVDAEAAPLQRHRAGHVDHRRLAHAVHADLAEHAQPGHRRDVDDAPAGEGARRRARLRAIMRLPTSCATKKAPRVLVSITKS
jgi:hypothetical protein